MGVAQGFSQCPAFGSDSTCGTIITITNTGDSITSTGQGPYNGADDTLIGVINNSSQPIHLIGIASAAPAFAFDGDGIDTYGAPGNGKDTTGYGGPNAYFTSINASQTSGIVNFISPIAPNGGTAYFSLEITPTGPYSCPDVVNGAVLTPPTGPTGSENIDISFTPNFGLSLQQAAQYCGVVNFDWIQHITDWPGPGFFYAANINGDFDPSINGPVLLTSGDQWSDPPPGGGYTYQTDYSYPFYYNATSGELLNNETGGLTLKFHDAPDFPCLSGSFFAGKPNCQNATAPAGSSESFEVQLAGVNADGSPTNLGNGIAYTTDYNGTSGGVYVQGTKQKADGNGTGGVTITKITKNTTYQYQGFTVTGINGVGEYSYVADMWRVQKYTNAGNYVSQFPINGGGRFLFGPTGMAIDSAGNFWLTDAHNTDVSEFDHKGNFIKSFGSYGSGNGQFLNGIGGIAVDTGGNVWVVDGGNDRVQQFSPSGVYERQLGSRGHGNGQFVGPVAVAIDSLNNVYIADSTRVQKFTSSGAYVSQFTFASGSRFVFGPTGMTLDGSGNFWLTDRQNDNVSEFNSSGNYLKSLGSYGSGNGQFLNTIGGIAVDLAGNVFVVDPGNNRVQEFTAAGAYESQFKVLGNSSVAVAIGTN